MQQNQLEAGESLVDFYSYLNSLRNTFKKKTISQDSLGEQAVKELLASNINQADLQFQQMQIYYDYLTFPISIQKYEVSFSGQIDFLVYELQYQPKSYQHSLQEIKEALEKAVDDMANTAFKMKLLQSNVYTHIAFGFIQTGAKKDVFKVGALVTKKTLVLEGIVYCKSTVQSGYIFVGRVLDPNKKPCMMVINKGTQTQIVIGPNKLVYNQENGEFRVMLHEIYYGLSVTDIFQNNQNFNLINVFVTPITDNSFQYGSGDEFPQDFNGYTQMEIGISEIIKDMNFIQHRNAQLQSSFTSFDLLNYGQQNQNLHQQQPSSSQLQRASTSIVTQQSSSSSQYAAIRKTRAQILKEQNAAQQKGQQPISSTNNITFSQNQTGTTNNQKITPTFNRSQTQIFIPANNTSTLQRNQPMLKQANTVINIPIKENTNPNSNNTTGFQINFKGSNFNPSQPQNLQQQNQKLQVNQTNVPAFQIQTNSTNQGFNPYQPKFSLNTQNNQPIQNKFQLSQPLQNQQALPTFKISFGQPTTQQSNNTNFNQQTTQNQQQFIQTRTIQPTIKFTGNNSNQQQTTNSTYQSTNINSQNITQMKIDTYQTPIPQQQDNSNRHLMFNQLSLIDQQTLQSYLKELQEDLSPEQMQKITALMLTDPFQFYEYFKIAHQELQKQKQLKNPTNSKNQYHETQKPHQQQQQKKIQEFDDLTLFLMTIPSTLIKQKEVKYQNYLSQLKEGQLLPRNLLKKLIIRNSYPVNESFKSMMNHKDSADLILTLRNEDFLCHKVVFQSTSEYFKSALKQNEFINKYKLGIEGPFKQKLLIPEWMDFTAFKIFINFVYSGKITGQSEQTQLDKIMLDIRDQLNLLKLANFFYHQCLQEQLIADIIIPQMTPQSAVIFLKQCVIEDSNHRNSCTYAWSFLHEYSQFYLQKHLSTLIRQNPQTLYELESTQLRKIIDKSLLYVVDGSKDLETILQFTADTWADRNICKLFAKSQSALDSASAFDFQLIPQLSDFLKQLDPSIDYQCRLVKGEDIKPKISSKAPSPTDSQSNKLNESTFIQQVQGQKDCIDNNDQDIDIAQWKPNANIIKEVASFNDIFDSQEPQYQTVIQLDAIKNEFEKNKGGTIFSKAFDFGRRSWNLKIDIDSDYNLSLYLIERGAPLALDNKNEKSQEEQLQIGVNIPIKFSSIIASFEILDPAFGEHKSLFFFSYAHDQNQAIGHQNIINLSQLQNKQQLNLKIHMKEFILHSAIIHYLTQNFQDFYRKDLKVIEQNKRNLNSIFSNPNELKEYDLLNIKFYNIYQILSSNQLKVEDENIVLGFIYYYTKVQSIKPSYRDNMIFIADLLTLTLRFYYLATTKIISALRDNETLRHSQLFMTKVKEEFNFRVSQPQLVLNIAGTNSKQLSKEQPRKFYDPIKIQSEGRKKIELSKERPSAQFIDELIEWLKTSKHDKKKEKHDFVDQEVKKWQNLYYEERKKYQNALTQQQLLERKVEQMQNYIDYGILPKRSVSINERINDYVQVTHQLPMNNYIKQISPIRKKDTPAFISNNDIVGTFKGQGAVAGFNNSFDHSLFVNNRDLLNDSWRQRGGSTAKAEKKIKENQQADLSMLLKRIDNKHLSPIQTKRNEQQYIPYYRQNRNNNSNKPNNGDQCRIF